MDIGIMQGNSNKDHPIRIFFYFFLGRNFKYNATSFFFLALIDKTSIHFYLIFFFFYLIPQNNQIINNNKNQKKKNKKWQLKYKFTLKNYSSKINFMNPIQVSMNIKF